MCGLRERMCALKKNNVRFGLKQKYKRKRAVCKRAERARIDS
jgi:hypothetical protein